jgi:ADP-heptose:LPS heptosyltransferase
MKWIFVRIDKMGDLICTLPVDQLAELQKSNAQVTWLIHNSLKQLMGLCSPTRVFHAIPGVLSWMLFWNLVRWIRSHKADGAILFYAPWWVSFAFWISRVPIRAGRRSQWHSYLFLNKGLRQNRSSSSMHEYEYNQELTEFALNLKKSQPEFVHLQPPQKSELLKLYHLDSKKFFIVHPGMAGSARNWDQDNYSALIEKLVQAGTVVVTATEKDEPYIDRIRAQWMGHESVRWLQDKLSLDELVFLISQAQCVIAPSTGVAHLAAGVGAPLVSLYSPMRAHLSTRWAPRGQGLTILEPRVECPASKRCWENRCTHFDCMNAIKINQVLRNIPSIFA